MATKKIFRGIEPIRTTFRSKVGVQYKPRTWNYYDISNRNKTITAIFRKEIDDPEVLWQATSDIAETEMEIYDEEYTVYIKIPGYITKNWKSLRYVYFDMMIYTDTTKNAIPGIFKWPVIRRVTNGEED